MKLKTVEENVSFKVLVLKFNVSLLEYFTSSKRLTRILN